jgi:hypothetical protein
MKITLPAVLNPISRRKDKSVKLSLETRELSPEETLTLMAMEGAEMWLALAPNAEQIEIPEEPAELEGKTISQRIKAALYVLYKQETEKDAYVGVFNNFYQEHGEKIIEYIKRKLD